MKGRRYKKQSFFSFISPTSNIALYRFVCVFVILAFLVIVVSSVVIGRNMSNGDVPVINDDPFSASVKESNDYASLELFGGLNKKTILNSEIGYGDLILVNYQYPCVYDKPQMVTMLEETQYNYSIADYTVTINSAVFDYADQLLGEFEKQNGGSSDLNVACAYRDRQLQEQLYNDKLEVDGQEEADKWIAKPGYSEHQTGYSFDLSIISGGYTYEYTGTDEYAWINNNCYKYGFIVRYPVERAETTKIEYEPWHFRYVGEPHAEYIYKNNLCFEDYIEAIHEKTPENPLIITSETGDYAVYYCAKNDASDQTSIDVPAEKNYTVSGDNINGFIVTVSL